jgi:hypothetical protein
MERGATKGIRRSCDKLERALRTIKFDFLAELKQLVRDN